MTIRSFAIAALLSTAGFAAPADKDVEALLAKMRKVYSATKTAKVSVVTLLAGELGETELTIETTYAQPNKISARVLGLPQVGSEGLAWKTDGKTIVQDTPTGKKKAKFTIQAAEGALPVNLEVINFWDWKRQLSTATGGNMKNSTFKIVKKETWKDKDFIVLEESATRQNVFVRYFIDPKTYFIMRTRVETLDKKDLVMDCKITKLELNPKVDPKVFQVGSMVKV